MADILHLHGFKCAGSTLSWILEHNYKDKLLYVEPKVTKLFGGLSRLHWDHLPVHVKKQYSSFSSHNIALPFSNLGDFKVIICFIRDPLERLFSAYNFLKHKQKIYPDDFSFTQYLVKCLESPIPNQNYLSRLLANQDQSIYDNSLSGWESIDYDFSTLTGEPSIFIGIVEEFDRSMLYLEFLLNDMSDKKFDFSYPAAVNSSSQKISNYKFSSEENELVALLSKSDMLLYEQSQDHLKSLLDATLKRDDIYDFHQRCKEKQLTIPKISIKGPSEWHYL